MVHQQTVFLAAQPLPGRVCEREGAADAVRDRGNGEADKRDINEKWDGDAAVRTHRRASQAEIACIDFKAALVSRDRGILSKIGVGANAKLPRTSLQILWQAAGKRQRQRANQMCALQKHQ